MKKVKMIFCAIFVSFISIIGIGTLNNDSESDKTETQTKVTEFDFSKYTDPEYLSAISTDVNEQLEFRSKLVEAYFRFNKDILNQTYIGGVVIGKDQVLFNGPFGLTDWDEYKKRIVMANEKINEVAEVARNNGTKLIIVDVPRKDLVLSEYVPDYYPDFSQKYLECLEVQRATLSEGIYVIDAYTLFQENKRDDGQLYYFYKDHHINPLGNELIYKEIMKIVQQDYPEAKQYLLDKYNIAYKQVNGSFNKKIAWTIESSDEILNISPNGWEVGYTRYDNGALSEKSILDENAISYNAAFMGGNIAETAIVTNRGDLPSIMYSGSSFTNALEALSVPSFDNVYSVDFRYNKTDNILNDYIEQWKPEYVVLISASSISAFGYDNFMVNLGYNRELAEIE